MSVSNHSKQNTGDAVRASKIFCPSIGDGGRSVLRSARALTPGMSVPVHGSPRRRYLMWLEWALVCILRQE